MRENIHVKSRREDLGARSERISTPLRRPCNRRDKTERRSRYDGLPGQPDDGMGRKELIPKAPTARPTLTSCLVDLRHPIVPHATPALRDRAVPSSWIADPLRLAPPIGNCRYYTIAASLLVSESRSGLPHQNRRQRYCTPFLPCLSLLFHFSFSLPSLSHDDVSSCGNCTVRPTSSSSFLFPFCLVTFF